MKTLLERTAEHIGATLKDGTMCCPECGGDFGPSIPLTDLATYELGYLPGAPLLVGVCLDCGYVVEPAPTRIAPCGCPAAGHESCAECAAIFAYADTPNGGA